jgi:hypothetical protein
MVQVAPNLYRKYITVDRKGMTILYVKMQKALYGLLRSALLFYNKLMADLEGNGFMLNPYDLCVANKVVDGKQMTVCWHVDNLKVSHCDPAQVTFFGEWLSEKYGVAVATHLGKVHDYLGMIFDFSPKGKVMVTFDLRFLAKRKGNGYHDGHQEYHKGLPGGDRRDKDIPCRGPSNFLFGQHSAPQLRFPPSRPNATQMYNKLLQYPSPKGILLLANHNWSLYSTCRFYGHSYLAPTPSITTVQSLGVSLIKAFAHHVRYA